MPDRRRQFNLRDFPPTLRWRLKGYAVADHLPERDLIIIALEYYADTRDGLAPRPPRPLFPPPPAKSEEPAK